MKKESEEKEERRERERTIQIEGRYVVRKERREEGRKGGNATEKEMEGKIRETRVMVRIKKYGKKIKGEKKERTSSMHMRENKGRRDRVKHKWNGLQRL